MNGPKLALPAESVATLVDRRAAEFPAARALLSEHEEVSYGEFAAAASRLAHLLLAKGIDDESIVAIALPRSPAAVIASLAVVKTGGAYLPIDLDHPPARIAVIIADANPALVITDTANAPAGLRCEYLLLDTNEIVGQLSTLPESGPAEPLYSPHRPYYIVYTSGSTGTPKGVVIRHQAVINRLSWMQATLGLHPGDRVLQKTSAGFDVAVWEMFWPLVAGGTVVIADQRHQKDPRYLARMIARYRVVTTHLVPSMLRMLLDEPEFANCVSLRWVICGGEVLTWQSQRRFYELLHADLYNTYGPTETTACTYWRCDPLVPDGPVPIGHPLANAGLLVLDKHLAPTATGVTGELYVAGPGLARGYLSRPGPTAARFVACPLGEPGTRMYRTGDMVRWLPDRALEFIGRIDNQLKIRGFRVELAEIEAVLSGHGSVAQAVVIAQDDGTGGKRLVSHIVPAVDAVAQGRRDKLGWELRLFTARQLPAYMVPAAFVIRPKLPLLVNGKVDRQALAAAEPTPAMLVPIAPTVLPGEPQGTQRQEILRCLFAEVLGVSQVGLEDSLFDLGGDSLTAIRLTSRVRAALATELDLRTVFDAPTVAELSRALIADRRVRPPLRLGSRREGEPVPLSYAQARLWFLHRLGERAGTYNEPIVMVIRGPLDDQALGRAIGDVVARHEVLRTLIRETGEHIYQHVLDSAHSAGMVDFGRHQAARADIADLIRETARRPFDLTTELPIRAKLLILAPGEHVLILVTHHIASDGWSTRPLLRDLVVAYLARLGGQPPATAPLTVQYADYAIWQRDLLGTADDPASLLSTGLTYWRQALNGLPDRIFLPTDRDWPASPSYRGDAVRALWTQDLHRAALTVARDNLATLFMVLHAGLTAVLCRLGAGTDIPLGIPVAGRSDEALDELVGFFVNTLVLRTDLAGDPSFRELLARVRQANLAAFDHQEIPFERLVEELNPMRSRDRHPLFQVMLALQNNAAAELPIPGLKVEFVRVDTGYAKFDLSFGFTERRSGDGSPNGLSVELEYCLDLFDQVTAESILRRFEMLMSAVLADPDRPIGEADIMTPAERELILVRWNDTGPDDTVV